jgi:hypothetical protein
MLARPSAKSPVPAPSQPPQTVLLPLNDEPDSETPAIVSQDPSLAAAWRTLFAKASRPPTYYADPPDSSPKHFQECLDLIERGPNTPYGDSIDEKLETLCRLYFVKVNDISSANEFLAFQEALNSLQASGVDIFGLAETYLDWLRHVIRDKCGKICRDFYSTALLATSTSSLRSNST